MTETRVFVLRRFPWLWRKLYVVEWRTTRANGSLAVGRTPPMRRMRDGLDLADGLARAARLHVWAAD